MSLSHRRSAENSSSAVEMEDAILQSPRSLSFLSLPYDVLHVILANFASFLLSPLWRRPLTLSAERIPFKHRGAARIDAPFSLLALRATCKTFNNMLTPQCFDSLNITISRKGLILLHPIDFLLDPKNTYILRYVRKLSLNFGAHPHQIITQDCIDWAGVHGAVAGILGRTVNLKGLAAENAIMLREGWTALPSLEALVLPFGQLPPLGQLRDVHFLQSLQNVRTLRVSWGTPSDTTVAILESCPQLRTFVLALGMPAAGIADILPWGTLEDLVVEVDVHSALTLRLISSAVEAFHNNSVVHPIALKRLHIASASPSAILDEEATLAVLNSLARAGCHLRALILHGLCFPSRDDAQSFQASVNSAIPDLALHVRSRTDEEGELPMVC